MYKDLFHKLKVGAPLFAGVQVTADGYLGNVLDRRDLSDPDGDLIGFIMTVDAAATADATNFIEFEVHEADEKTSATALTSGAKAADADILGWTDNGVRSRVTNPNFDANAVETTRTDLQYNQDGFYPKVDATTMAGHAFWFAYRGYKTCLQIYANETGTADVTVTCIPVYASRKTRNMVNPATTT